MELEHDVVGMYLQPSDFYYLTEESHRRLWYHPDSPDEFFLVIGKIAVPLEALSDMMDWVGNIEEDE